LDLREQRRDVEALLDEAEIFHGKAHTWIIPCNFGLKDRCISTGISFDGLPMNS
jgi:hypothetical protein